MIFFIIIYFTTFYPKYKAFIPKKQKGEIIYVVSS